VAVAPGLLLVAVFVVPPVLAALGLSLFRIELTRDDITPFVGLRNYATRMPAEVGRRLTPSMPATTANTTSSTSPFVHRQFAPAALPSSSRRSRFTSWWSSPSC